MKITIYNAISIDGFIARENYDTDWVSNEDWLYFKKLVKESEVIVMGRKTFETSGDDFPYDCRLNVVMSKNAELLNKKNKFDNVIFYNDTPEEVVKRIEQLGYKKLLIIGGGKLNASFIKENLVNEVIVDIHPIALGTGIKLFSDCVINKILRFKETITKKSGLTIIKYKVI